ncbi:alpha/beta hydrolase [Nocardia arthritidis]|uniref:Alpha/beta fold hydrolase n=1 Tax=Nocardia arthritidis TaxID=228602 RepID=A0A6G9Y6G0_9NOCA|nr:alpha/beta hydrolase [Nocardia arthritidis]QIS08724.1 alpha/beta fold hydrolase [Nocardia arthritidis]
MSGSGEQPSGEARVEAGMLRVDGELIAYERRIGDRAGGFVVFLHGAGTGSMERTTQLATEVVAAGANTVAFDFSGHGRSTGTLAELSLRRREVQAAAVIGALCDPGAPLVLVGFSMSGQTVCDIIGSVGADAVFLCCPAAYRPDVAELPFGNPEFTRMIREEGAWSASTAFGAVAAFPGEVAFVIPDQDEVIPPALTRTYLDSRPDSLLLTLPGCPHRIAGWLRNKPEQRQRLVAAMSRAADPGQPVL